MLATLRAAWLLITLPSVFCAAVGFAAEDEESFAQQRDRAVKEGVAYLLRQQEEDGGWFSADTPGGNGRTAFCTLALIESGVPLDDPALKSAAERVIQFPEPKLTYTTSLQTVVLCRLSPAAHRSIIERNVRWLERSQVAEGRRGAWAYSADVGKGDGSNSRFAVWALHEAEAADVTVQTRVWKRTLEYWLSTQRDDGAWRYSDFTPPTGSITLDGIACVCIATQHLPGDKKHRQAADQALVRAWDWLAKRFRVDRNPSDDDSFRWHHYYYLHALAEAATLDQRDSIGNRDWRREGTELLLKYRDPFGGSWAGSGLSDQDRRIATSFALLFLATAQGEVQTPASPP